MDHTTLKTLFPNASASVLAANAPVATVKPIQADSPDDFPEPPNAFIGNERILHSEFSTDMDRRGVHYVHARPDKRSTIETGLPDFHLLYTGTDGVTRGCAIEFKSSGGRVKPEQAKVIVQMRKNKVPVLVAWSLADAIVFTRKHLMC